MSKIVKESKVKKPRKSKQKDLWIAVCLDESGSMNSTRDTVISGVNEFLGDRAKDSEIRPVKIWINKFNSKSTTLVNGEDAKSVQNLTKETYSPNGWTALLDSVGESVSLIDTAIKGEKVKPDVVVLIVTDGQENSSKEYTKETVKTLIESRTKEGWNFEYFGSSLDTFNDAKSLGISKGQTIMFSAAKTGQMLNSNSARYTRQAKFGTYTAPEEIV